MRALFLLLGLLVLLGCTPVKPYQKMYLNDKDMQLGVPTIQWHDFNADSYREGAAGGGGSKTGGGCGCN